MTSGFEHQLQALFSGAEQELPVDAFAAGVTAAVRSHRRRTKLVQCCGVLVTAVILWLLAPDIARGARAAAGLPGVMLGVARTAAPLLAQSSLAPLVGLYSGVFAGYVVLNVLQRFRIRRA